MTFLRWILVVSMILLPQLAIAGGSASHDHLVAYVVEGVYEEVRFDIVSAITERGMVVNNVSHIGDMLERTGRDIGENKQIYLKAEALEFCSATISRATMAADPFNIVFCPYIITLFVTPDKPDLVNIAFRRPVPVGSEASKKTLRAVHDLLDGIVRDALE